MYNTYLSECLCTALAGCRADHLAAPLAQKRLVASLACMLLSTDEGLIQPSQSCDTECLKRVGFVDLRARGTLDSKYMPAAFPHHL